MKGEIARRGRETRTQGAQHAALLRTFTACRWRFAFYGDKSGIDADLRSPRAWSWPLLSPMPLGRWRSAERGKERRIQKGALLAAFGHRGTCFRAISEQDSH